MGPVRHRTETVSHPRRARSLAMDESRVQPPPSPAVACGWKSWYVATGLPILGPSPYLSQGVRWQFASRERGRWGGGSVERLLAGRRAAGGLGHRA